MAEFEPLLIKEEKNLPSSTKWTVYFMMVLFGLASLLPWNMVITATGYFHNKFQETNSTVILEGFPSYFQIGGIGSNVFISLSSMIILKHVSIKPVMLACNSLVLVIFVMMTVMAKLTTITWPMTFFALTNVMFCIACGASAAYISGMMAIASMLTSNAIAGFYLGQGAAGFFATLLSIITLSIPGADPVTAGFYYFLIASCSLVIALVAYFMFSKMSYVRNSTMRSEDKDSAEAGGENLTSLQVFRKIWKYCAANLVTLLITLTCFPAALSSLKSSSQDTEGQWVTTYFVPVITFLFFNIGDVLGRITSSFVSLPSKRFILPVALCRIAFIPLIYMCNLQPRTLNVWFASDAWPAIFNLLMSWSNGHILSLSAAYGPQEVESKSAKSMAGTYAAFCSSLGLVIGSMLVFPFLAILKV